MIAVVLATLFATTIPDGTYTVVVDRVVDSSHVEVVLEGGEVTLAAGRPTVDFSKVHSGDHLELSLINGDVMVFIDQTNP